MGKTLLLGVGPRSKASSQVHSCLLMMLPHRPAESPLALAHQNINYSGPESAQGSSLLCSPRPHHSSQGVEVLGSWFLGVYAM